ncbi:MAG: efflux RND transporter periplasmic adaptor subunit [Verrucomicrobiota bacterium]
MPIASVRVQPIAPGKHQITEEVVGTVRARTRAVLEAKISGRIERMLAAPGQAVRLNALLVQLDVQEIRARLEQARAQHEQAERDLKRYEILIEQNAITRQEFDAAQARQRVAKAGVAEAETLLGYAQITAPFDGVITRKFSDVGDLALPGKALLELEDPTALRLEADVSEALIDWIQPAQTLNVRVQKETIGGRVAEIAPAANPATRTFLVKLDLPAWPGLRSGAFGRVAVPLGESQTLRVPVNAVVRRGQLEYIVIANAGKAQLRLVKTGKMHGMEVELLAGATAGERVVISDPTMLRDGQPLQIQP